MVSSARTVPLCSKIEVARVSSLHLAWNEAGRESMQELCELLTSASCGLTLLDLSYTAADGFLLMVGDQKRWDVQVGTDGATTYAGYLEARPCGDGAIEAT